ncbi:MAG: hypothetical protein Q7R56_02765 [Nanoarchaeota archaeon]|nr:hypothetical protein [Nanoarchaeota archaeon]
MTDKKLLYVIQAAHLMDGLSIEDARRYGLFDQDKLRLAAMRVFGRTMDEGSYFQDGLDDEMAELGAQTLEMIAETDGENTKEDLEFWFKDGSLGCYFYFETLACLHQLRKNGHTIMPRETELSKERGLAELPRKIFQLALDGDSDYKELLYPDVGSPEFAEAVERLLMKYRDEKLVLPNIQRIIDSSGILFMGSKHPLEKLRASPEFEIYELAIDNTERPLYCINGRVSERQRCELERELSETQIPIVNRIKYISEARK